MTNATIIQRLTDITMHIADDNFYAKDEIKRIITDLKEEELLKGYKPSEKERVQLAKRLQEKGFKRFSGNKLALYHKLDDDMYVWTDSAFLVKVSKDFVEKNELATTDQEVVKTRKGMPYYVWHANASEYPNTKNIWLKSYKLLKVNVQKLMTFLKANKEQEVITLRFDDTTKMCFSRELLYNTMVLSNAFIKDEVEFRYLEALKPINVDDIAIATPLRVWDSDGNEQSYVGKCYYDLRG